MKTDKGRDYTLSKKWISGRHGLFWKISEESTFQQQWLRSKVTKLWVAQISQRVLSLMLKPLFRYKQKWSDIKIIRNTVLETVFDSAVSNPRKIILGIPWPTFFHSLSQFVERYKRYVWHWTDKSGDYTSTLSTFILQAPSRHYCDHFQHNMWSVL